MHRLKTLDLFRQHNTRDIPLVYQGFTAEGEQTAIIVILAESDWEVVNPDKCSKIHSPKNCSLGRFFQRIKYLEAGKILRWNPFVRRKKNVCPV